MRQSEGLRRHDEDPPLHLTAEEQKKLEQVLKRLKQRDVQLYFLAVLQEQWLNLG